jgi:hypothetical protein
VVDAGGVDDPRRLVEAVAVEARGRLVEGLVVERLRECALLEVAAHDRHLVDRRDGRNAQAAQRRDQAAAGGVGERQVVDRRGEDVRDLLRDQLLGRGHADVDRLRERANGRGGLLAERRVRLVCNHEVVRLAADVGLVAGEPCVGLDRERVRPRRALSAFDRGDDAVAVALSGEVARELRDEQPSVREDEHAERAGRFHESRGGDRLPGGGRVPEAVAPYRARILALPLARLVLVGLVRNAELVLRLVLLGLGRLFGDGRRAVAVRTGVLLVARDQLRQHPGERVHLVAAKLRARGEARRLLGQDPLQPEHEAEADAPARGRRRAPRLHFGQRLVERLPAPLAGREHLGRVLGRVEEGLAGPDLGAPGSLDEGDGRLRCSRQVFGRRLHRRSAVETLPYPLRSGALRRTPRRARSGSIPDSRRGRIAA